jgi:type IV secretory pathway VirJ component
MPSGTSSGPHAPDAVHAQSVTDAPDAPTWTPVTEQKLNHGRFENFTVYAPHATPRGFVLLLSGADGWNQGTSDMARRLAQQGAMVAGIDVAQLNAKLEADGAQCVFPDGDLENLSHFVQAYYRLSTYLSPVLAGYSAGATLAYATLAQAPTNTFAGAVSIGFCPGYASPKHLCKSSGLDFTLHTGDSGVDFLPSRQIGNPWIVLQGKDRGAAAGKPQSCDAAAVRSFVAQVPNAQLIVVPNNGSDASPPPGWAPQYAAAFDTLMARNAPGTLAAAPSALGDLPIVAIAAQAGTTPSDTFAIMLSGDGGWAGLDKDVAGALTASGIPVIGLDSLRYFWSARSPEGLAADLDRMIRYYLTQLGKQRVVLIGYSQGADVLPFAVNRLNPAVRSHVALMAIMGMSEHALFEFHVASWISDDNSGPATLPEVERISGIPVLCIYGEEESDSLCPKLDPHGFTIVKLKGGHHFDGNYENLARTILASARQ